MKKSKIVFMAMSIILMGSLVLTCEKDNDKTVATDNEVSFAINVSNLKSASMLKSAMDYNLEDADKIVLTILNSDGSPTKYTSSEVKIQQMNGDYYTQKIVLKTGDYNLTEFIILNAADSTIFATPLTGSLEAQNVSNSLPNAFSVAKDITTPVNVEVLSAEKKTPEDFGLSSFPIIEVKTFGFMIGVADIENDRLLSAQITVSNGDYSYVQGLDSIANNVVTVKDSLDNYILAIEKSGYITYLDTFSIDLIKTYENLPGNLSLLVELEKITIPTEGLVAYFPFNGNANDESSNENNGTVYGATLSTDRFGNTNSAYSFDGINDYINCGNSNILNPTKISISTWINVIGSTSFHQGIVTKWYEIYNCSYNLQLKEDGITPSWHVQREGGSHYDDLYLSSNSQCNFNTWYHLVVIFDNQKSYIYLNNINVAEGNYNYFLNSTDRSLMIGRMDNNIYPNWFNGKIDDVRIYNRALSGSEIQALYNEGK